MNLRKTCIVFPVTAFFLLALSVNAQPPTAEGKDKDFLSPLTAPVTSSNVCDRVTFRELDGQCTSQSDPSWGQARLGQFSYFQGRSSSVPTGGSLPSARELSNIIFDQKSDTKNSLGLNQLFVFFGQFLDHCFASTPTEASERFDIPVETSDPELSVRTLSFQRSVRGKVDRSGSERPINSAASAVDLTAVYGSNPVRNNELIEFNSNGSFSGRLKTSAGNLLPLNTGGYVNSPDTSARFFLAGDHRSNEHPVLTTMHTIFLREHNSLATDIRRMIPSLPSRLVYEYARLLNIAQFQKIVYEEFYPAIVGRELPLYSGFRPRVDPTISDVFIGAAFRIGHTMVSNEIPRRGASGPLSPARMPDIFFRPASTFSSSEVDNIIRGTANAVAQEVDEMVVDALRNGLFEAVPSEEGFDLIALNIQRGRDHALPKFNEIRELFGIPKARRFEEISSNPRVAEKLARAYRNNVDDVEAFPGLLAEDHAGGAGMGKTMLAVWDTEFRRLRDGDQFFFARTNVLPNIIRVNLASYVQRLETRGGITFRDIILRNSGVTNMQLPSGNIFKVGSSGSGGSLVDPSPSPSPQQTPTPTRAPICRKAVCCAGSCGSCGGDGCADRPGGREKCCVSTIEQSRIVCSSTVIDGCIQGTVDPNAPSPSPVCRNGVCCAGTCQVCGGQGCDLRAGGVSKCCETAIRQSGVVCSSEIVDACIQQ